MSKKNQRKITARNRLVELAGYGELFCTKHNEILRPHHVYNKRCYMNRGSVKDCKYLRYEE